MTEANWIRDDFPRHRPDRQDPVPPTRFGAAQYLSYVLSDTATFNARLRRSIATPRTSSSPSFTGNDDFVRGELGLPFLSPVLAPAKPTTYGALTLGVTFNQPARADHRPAGSGQQLRYDAAANRHPAVKNGTATGQLTLSSDFVLTF